MLFTSLVAVAAWQSLALRPENGGSRSAIHDEDAKEAECPQFLQPPPPTATNPACFITKGGYNDGIGHQLFGTLSVMGMHGVKGDLGHCHVYSAAPREFAFHHLKEGGQAWDEALALMTGLYEDFRRKFSSTGCATADLIARDPAKRVPMCKNRLLLGEIPCHESSTWELDNMWYGAEHRDAQALQLKTVTPFMEAVVRNATQLAALAAGHLPTPERKLSLAVHMRFGDRAPVLRSVLLGQLALFEDAKLGEFSPKQILTDAESQVVQALDGTAIADADVSGPGDSTVLQAIARMVAADVFIGSRSDVSSCAAMMRIGLGKKHTYMPERWQWAHSFSDADLTVYPEIKPAE